ncbi:MAG: beta-ketoacyl-ACP synthase II [Thermoguttaceae bacterium]|nr:beta-ketoacyl-ACP synthase II [Thermoguttaceae bacterium]MBQ9800468.1 beta-ketoacyl-ACP synthase II [Thermoguttaceae bacterium]
MNRRVVVTGMGAVTPVGIGVRNFWANLKAGVCGIGPITRFDASRVKSSLAGEVKNFDPLDWLEKAEVVKMDRSAQFAVAAASEAMQLSGVAGTVDPNRAAVYLGTGIGGFETNEANCFKLFDKGPRRVSPFFVPMMIANMPAGLLAIRYDFRGAALPAVTACASGTNAIGEAVRAIRHGYADVALTGGTEAPIVEVGVAGFNSMKALATAEDPNAASLPFDARRAGFVIAEGAGVLVLEEYERAKNRGAKIYGEICGYGSTCDAYHMTAPRPDADGAARAVVEALREADWKAGESVYVNAHGTGTHLNDVAETRALKIAFGEDEARRLAISSTKSATGHMLGAAGAVEAIVCLKALAENVAPPTLNLLEPDPECDLDYIPSTKREAKFDLAISNSFGFGGHNACLAFRRIGG